MKNNKKFNKFAVGSLAAAAVIGLGGGYSYALWHDEENITTNINVGKVAFGVGDPDKVVGDSSKFTTNGTALTYSIGKTAASILVKDKKVAVPIEVDAMVLGRQSMDYTVKNADWSGGVFGESDVRVFKVNSPTECTTSNTADTTSEDSWTNNIIKAGYKTSTEATKQYWCVVAVLKPVELGKYTNDGTVTGVDDTEGSTVTSTDTWEANVIKDLKPENESDHILTFTPTLGKGV